MDRRTRASGLDFTPGLHRPALGFGAVGVEDRTTGGRGGALWQPVLF